MTSISKVFGTPVDVVGVIEAMAADVVALVVVWACPRRGNAAVTSHTADNSSDDSCMALLFSLGSKDNFV